MAALGPSASHLVSSLASKSLSNANGISKCHRPVVIEAISGLPALWGQTTGDRAVSIGILDAPVDDANPCLQSAKIEERWLGHQAHCSAHGTEVASIIFAPHNTAVPGIAPGCRGISIPIYDCEPERSPSTNQGQLARAIYEALAAGVHVINVSAGQLVPTGAAEAELAAAVRACAAAGVLIVAAAGNDGCDCLHVPAALPCVLAVGAMRGDGTPLPGSNWGSIYAEQGILAPGEDIPVAGPQGRPELRTGTSFATAIVSGVAALLLSRERKRGRPIRPLLIRKALLAAADSLRQTGSDRRLLAGRLNLIEAMILLDTWSNTMTHENVELARECNAPSNNGSDLAAVNPSCEPTTASLQPSRHESAPVPQTRHRESADAVQPSACAACRGERQLVYAHGQIGYDFGTEAGLDAFRPPMEKDKSNPLNEAEMAKFLEKEKYKHHAMGLLWTLSVDHLPIYVVRPEGPFAEETYRQLRELLKEKHVQDATKRSERIAVAGVITGQTRLLNGLQVPVINPDPRGLHNWNTGALITDVIAAVIEDHIDAKNKELEKEHKPKLTKAQQDDLTNDLTKQLHPKLDGFVPEFLYRIYYELRNAGRTSRERALNYAGTNLFEFVKIVLSKMLTSAHSLDAIDAVPSSLFRPGSDCWDVTLAFFDSSQAITNVRWHHRYTIDVSEVIPVTVGETRSWRAR
jgi:cyanobactin maturation PatA/PatG family protease